MILIIGGANQGKTDYAVKKYNLTDNDFGIGKRCLDDFHLFIKSALENDENPLESANKILIENPDTIIIMNEIGNGIIPLEKSERIWREQVGLVGCMLAQKAEKVERIICGISLRIK